MAWGENARRQLLIKRLVGWKEGTHNPTENGAPLPLSCLELKIASDGSGRSIGQWNVRPDTDPVELADAIVQEATEHAENYNIGGTMPTYLVWPFFGRQKVNGKEFTLQVNPAAQHGNEGQPFMGSLDLRDRRNQEATVISQAVALSNRNSELMVGGFGTILTTMDRLNEKLLDRMEKVEARCDMLVAREQEVMDRGLERQIRAANEEMKIKLKNAVGEQAVAAIPGLMAGVHRALGKKMGIDPSDIPKEVMALGEMIFKDPKKVAAILEGLSPEEQQKAIFLVQQLQKKKEMEVQEAQYKATMDGVSRPLPLAKFKVIAGGGGQEEEKE